MAREGRMAKVTVHIRHVSWRDGRPRFQPGKALRALGYKGEDLRHGPGGRWYTLDEAAAWSEQREKDIAERRRQAAEGKRLKPVKRTGLYTVEQMFEDLWKAPKFTGARDKGDGKKRQERTLAPKTVKDYRQKADSLIAFDPELAGTAVAALTTPILIGLHERLWQEKGHHMANGVMAVLRLGLSYAVRKGKLAVNPARGLRLETPPPRLRVGTIREMEHLVAAADAIGDHMIGHSIMLGLFTGQRQADRLALMDAGSSDGWRRFRQGKTGAVVEVPEAPQLAVRLAAAREWREARGVKVANVVVHPATHKPYDLWSYTKHFARVRTAAAEGVKEKGIEPMPSLATFRDQDLRDTAVTWLARAGCTIPMIRAITGHDEESVYKILKHYLAVDRELAGQAIERLVGYLEQKGAKL